MPFRIIFTSLAIHLQSGSLTHTLIQTLHNRLPLLRFAADITFPPFKKLLDSSLMRSNTLSFTFVALHAQLFLAHRHLAVAVGRRAGHNGVCAAADARRGGGR